MLNENFRESEEVYYWMLFQGSNRERRWAIFEISRHKYKFQIIFKERHSVVVQNQRYRVIGVCGFCVIVVAALKSL